MGFPTVVPDDRQLTVDCGNLGQVQDRAGLLDAYQAGDTTKSGYATHPHVMKIAGTIPRDQNIVPVLIIGTTRNATKLTGIGGGNDFCSGSIIINRGRKKRGPRPVHDDVGGLGKIDHLFGRLVPHIRVGGWIVLGDNDAPLIIVVFVTGIPHVAGIVTVHNAVAAVQLAARGTQDSVTDQPTIRNRKGAMPRLGNTIMVGLAAQ